MISGSLQSGQNNQFLERFEGSKVRVVERAALCSVGKAQLEQIWWYTAILFSRIRRDVNSGCLPQIVRAGFLPTEHKAALPTRTLAAPQIVPELVYFVRFAEIRFHCPAHR